MPWPDTEEHPPIDLEHRLQRDLGRIEGINYAERLLRRTAASPDVNTTESAYYEGMANAMLDLTKKIASDFPIRRTIVVAKGDPRIVCICGSTRFAKRMNQEADRLTREGFIVVRPEVVTYSARRDPQKVHPALKKRLDALHMDKIDLADEVLVVNVNGRGLPRGGYIGKSTTSEIEHAIRCGKPVTYLVDPA